ncbi:MAG: hypothetical protein ACK5JF_03280 [Oscillospiraceae bacterium]
MEIANKCFEALQLLMRKPITRKSLGNLHTSIMATGEVEYWKKQQLDYLGSIRTVQSKSSLEPGTKLVNIDITTAAAVLSVSFNTANKIINTLIGIVVLKPLDDKKRYKVYVYSLAPELLN